MSYFCAVEWTLEHLYGVISCSAIVSPRKELANYSVGEAVLAKFQGKTYPARIISVSDNKVDLNGRLEELIRKEITPAKLKPVSTKVSEGSQNERLGHVGEKSSVFGLGHVGEKSSICMPNRKRLAEMLFQEIITEEKNETSQGVIDKNEMVKKKPRTENIDRKISNEQNEMVKKKQRTENIDRKISNEQNEMVKKKQRTENIDRKISNEQEIITVEEKNETTQGLIHVDKAAQVKKDCNKKRRERDHHREATTQHHATSIFKDMADMQEKMTSEEDNRRRFDMLEDKIDRLQTTIESFLNCKSCLKKAYRKLPDSDATTSRSAVRPTSMTSDTRTVVLHSPVSVRGSPAAVRGSPAAVRGSPAAVRGSPAADREFSPATLDSYKTSSMGLESAMIDSDTGYSFLGDAKYDVQMKTEDLERCEKAAKTSEKLALNLVEFLLNQEEIMTVSVYGNKQHNKVPMDANKRKALRSHIISHYPDTKEKEWEKLVTVINDKIRGLRNGKYKHHTSA